MSTTLAEPEYRFLRGQTWQDYERALAERARQGRRYRITYDRGVLEIMPNSVPHEQWKGMIRSLLEMFLHETAIPFECLGSSTCRREDLDRGLEPDECYYIRNEPMVRGRTDVDLETDPPPDLAMEIEVTRSAVDRLGIYAALGVAEVWRFDGITLTVLTLGEDGEYAAAATSLNLPTLPLGELARRVAQRGTTDRHTWMRQWQAWVRANVPG